MGKRELLLILGFIVFGAVVYQVTAGPADPARSNWSFGGMIQKIRREVSSNSASAKSQTTVNAPVPDSVHELRIVMRSGRITVAGEDRDDVAITVDVSSTGYDQAEAERLAKATAVKLDQAGAILIATVDYPVEGRQTASLEIKLPKRLTLRLDEKSGVLTVSDVGGVVIGAARGETKIARIDGPVQITQRGSVITMEDVESIRLNTFSGAEARIAKVRGDASFILQGGELRAEELTGVIEIESRNTDVRLEKLEQNRGTIRINANNGEIVLEGLQTETRIDGRDADIRVTQSKAAVLSIYNDGDEPIELTVPPDGFIIDAVSTEGKLTVDNALESAGIKVTGTGSSSGTGTTPRQEYRANATVRGGGPTLTLRATRGDISLRSR
jgi:hypothetical protein